MKQFGTLVFYEMKKIMYRKNTWITIGILLILCLVLMAGMSFGSSYVEGEILETHKEGNAIDRKNGLNPFTVTEEEFYEARERAVSENWEKCKLKEKEKEYWQEKEDKLRKPFTYQYAEGYGYLISMNGVYMVCLLTTFLIAICMSCVFTEEHGKKTDQLILCSRLGRKQTYFAKILAGTVFSFLSGILFLVVTVAGSFLAYGSEGGLAMLQLFAPDYSYPLTVFQVLLIFSGILLLACVMTGIFAMALSEITKSNIGTMAAIVAIMFISRLIQVPENIRMLSQLMNLFPLNILKLDAGFIDMRLFSIFGLKLTSWQFAPFLYALLIGIFVLVGKKVYCRYQVQGR